MTPADATHPGSLAAASREALSAAGALAQADARHVERAVQLRMAEAVAEAIENRTALVAEANHAFDLNRGVFAGLHAAQLEA